jgi:hypothetical protein
MPAGENDFNLTPNTAFGVTGMRIAHAQYSFATDGGAISTITPINNFTLPLNSIVIGASLNSTTALTSGGSATIAVGLIGGGGTTTSLVGATAVASWSLNAKVQATPVPQTASTWIKLTASAQASVTIATATVTAGSLVLY